SSDVCSSDLQRPVNRATNQPLHARLDGIDPAWLKEIRQRRADRQRIIGQHNLQRLADLFLEVLFKLVLEELTHLTVLRRNQGCGCMDLASSLDGIEDAGVLRLAVASDIEGEGDRLLELLHLLKVLHSHRVQNDEQ